MKKKLAALLAMFFVAAGLTFACNPANASGYVHVEGQKIIAPDGTTLNPRGVVLGDWLLIEAWLTGQTGQIAPVGMTTWLNKMGTLVGQPTADNFRRDYANHLFSQSTLTAIADAGFNTVRVPFNAKYFNDQLPVIDNVIQWAKNAGLYVVLDMHGATASQNPYLTSDATDGTARLWLDANARSASINVWRTLAARYADEPAIAGYDLLNEPDGWAMTNAALVQFYRDATAAIRSFDTHHPVIFEGRSFTKDMSMFTSPIDPNAIMSFHQYLSSTLTPATQINNAIAAADKLGGLPVWAGEFGLDTAANVDRQLTIFDKYPRIVGWSYWSWKFAARADNQDAIREYQAPADWVAVINWATGKSTTTPTPEQVQQAMWDEVNALDASTLNQPLLSVLQAHL